MKVQAASIAPAMLWVVAIWLDLVSGDDNNAWVIKCGKSQTDCDLRNSFCEDKMDKCSSCPDYCAEWRIVGNSKQQQQCYQICQVWMYLNEERRVQESQLSFSDFLQFTSQICIIILTLAGAAASVAVIWYIIIKRNEEDEQRRAGQRFLTQNGEKPQIASAESSNNLFDDENPSFSPQHHQHGSSRQPLLFEQNASTSSSAANFVNCTEVVTTPKDLQHPGTDT